VKHNYSILYVEDDEITRNVLRRQLERLFTKVITAENGQQGLELYEKEMPDVVVTDLCMPVMSGFEMIQNIQSKNTDVYIIVTTAFRGESETLDVDKVLHKPINAEDILKVLQDRLL